MGWDDTTIIQPAEQLLYTTVYSLLSDMCCEVVEQELNDEVKFLSRTLAAKEEELIGIRLALATMNELPSPSHTRARIGEHAARVLEMELAGMRSEQGPRTRTRGSIGVEQETETDVGLSISQVRRLGKGLIHEVFVKAKGSKVKALQLLGHLNVRSETQILREGAARRDRTEHAKQEIVDSIAACIDSLRHQCMSEHSRQLLQTIYMACSSGIHRHHRVSIHVCMQVFYVCIIILAQHSTYLCSVNFIQAVTTTMVFNVRKQGYSTKVSQVREYGCILLTQHARVMHLMRQCMMQVQRM